jgi:hypothetical protein
VSAASESGWAVHPEAYAGRPPGFLVGQGPALSRAAGCETNQGALALRAEQGMSALGMAPSRRALGCRIPARFPKGYEKPTPVIGSPAARA